MKNLLGYNHFDRLKVQGQTQTYEYDCLDRVVKIIGSQGARRD